MKLMFLYNVQVTYRNPQAVNAVPHGHYQPLFYAENLEQAIEKAKKYYESKGIEIEVYSCQHQGGQPIVF